MGAPNIFHPTTNKRMKSNKSPPLALIPPVLRVGQADHMPNTNHTSISIQNKSPKFIMFSLPVKCFTAYLSSVATFPSPCFILIREK
jgi:hypothetical protein